MKLYTRNNPLLFFQHVRIVADHGGLIFLCAGLADESDQFVEDFSGEVAATPVKGENFSFFGCLEGTLVYVLHKKN